MPALPRRKGESAKRAKMRTVMTEFRDGTLHSGSTKGPKVTDRKQAIAIGLQQSGTGKPKRKKTATKKKPVRKAPAKK
jgi:hypothetical protein